MYKIPVSKGLIETVLELFEFTVLYRSRSKIWDKDRRYPLEISLQDFRFGGLAYRQGNTFMFYNVRRKIMAKHPGSHGPKRKPVTPKRRK